MDLSLFMLHFIFFTFGWILGDITKDLIGFHKLKDQKHPILIAILFGLVFAFIMQFVKYFL